MMRRAFHLLLVAFSVLWFAVVIPGHTRGSIQLPGSDAGSCCPSLGAATNPEKKSAPCCPSESGSNPFAPKNCAVCQIVGTMQTPEMPTFFEPRVGLIEILPIARTTEIPLIDLLGIPLHRGPPAIA